MFRNALGGFSPVAALATLSILSACDGPSDPTGTELEEARSLPMAVAESQVEGNGASFFRVLTRNIYLGGETAPLFTVDFANVPQVLAAVNTFWDQVQATDFPARAAALADEIGMTDPHLVGLQEVARYTILDGSGAPQGQVDFLPILLDALAARGLDYQVAARQDNTNGTLPLDVDLATFLPSRLLNFVVGDATLVRADVPILDTDQANYAARIQFDTPLGPVTVQRGWTRVTVDFNGVPHHVHNTHLETQGILPVHNGQADELLGAVLADMAGVTMVIGDLNSDAEASPGDRSWTPTYGRFLEAGFMDAWDEAVGNDGIGYTCCQPADLQNGPSELDERIDFVLIRTEGALPENVGLPGAVRAALVGAEQADRTEAGLWPADHAGLFAALQIPRGLFQH